MADYFGIACGNCGHLNDIGANQCMACHAGLDLGPASEHETSTRPVSMHTDLRVEGIQLASEPSVVVDVGTPTSNEEFMEQARTYVCKQCSTPVPLGHRFCGACGAPVPEEVLNVSTDYFGSMQTPGRARLVLIRGDEGAEGLSYVLQGDEHFLGREDGQIQFCNDHWLSPRHANFCYQGDDLVVIDEGSTNGVFWRTHTSHGLQIGDQFLCGEQVFRVEATTKNTASSGPDKTQYYTSPRLPGAFRVVQILEGGSRGMECCARDGAIRIGRYDNDMNFPNDVYMSAQHARIESSTEGALRLVDEGSKNGTYLRIRGTQKLAHGDYVFVGHQLLRVEVTA